MAPRTREVGKPGIRPRTTGGTIRIIAGRWRRRSIEVADLPGLRPTPDRVRETLFNWLTHAFGGSLDGRSVLDLYAGSGALGFEAASRGAAPVILVEIHAVAVERLCSVRAQLDAAQIDIRSGDALRVGAQLQEDGRCFDLVLLDPPFREGSIDRVLPLAAALCTPSGFVYVEAESPLSAATLSPLELEIYRSDKAGEVFYHLLQRKKTT